MAGLFITKLVREAHGLDVSPGAQKTIGQMIDETITDLLASNQELHEITVNLEPEDWSKIRDVNNPLHGPDFGGGNGKTKKADLRR